MFWKLLLGYAYYLVLTHPFFLMLVYGSEKFKQKTFGQDIRRSKRKISEKQVRAGRSKSSKERFYLGTSLWTGRPFYLTDEMRKMHMLVTGSTGVGKTESVLLPALRHDIEAGKGMVLARTSDDEAVQHVKARSRIIRVSQESKQHGGLLRGIPTSA